ncbi:hypothetical protein GYMLUDRAFT_976391 [Collybiopsis luxurians FD-317 M1]|nr:hypothetical protein GYMLUDRAFT_976391 [Collybiopsis luxurians FD-317 M1]
MVPMPFLIASTFSTTKNNPTPNLMQIKPVISASSSSPLASSPSDRIAQSFKANNNKPFTMQPLTRRALKPILKKEDQRQVVQDVRVLSHSHKFNFSHNCDSRDIAKPTVDAGDAFKSFWGRVKTQEVYRNSFLFKKGDAENLQSRPVVIPIPSIPQLSYDSMKRAMPCSVYPMIFLPGNEHQGRIFSIENRDI